MYLLDNTFLFKNYIRDGGKMKIREHRKSKRLTLHQLSSLSGVSVTQIQAVETGKSDPGNMSAKNLLAIAKALDANPFELIASSE